MKTDKQYQLMACENLAEELAQMGMSSEAAHFRRRAAKLKSKQPKGEK